MKKLTLLFDITDRKEKRYSLMAKYDTESEYKEVAQADSVEQLKNDLGRILVDYCYNEPFQLLITSTI